MQKFVSKLCNHVHVVSVRLWWECVEDFNVCKTVNMCLCDVQHAMKFCILTFNFVGPAKL